MEFQGTFLVGIKPQRRSLPLNQSPVTTLHLSVYIGKTAFRRTPMRKKCFLFGSLREESPAMTCRGDGRGVAWTDGGRPRMTPPVPGGLVMVCRKFKGLRASVGRKGIGKRHRLVPLTSPGLGQEKPQTWRSQNQTRVRWLPRTGHHTHPPMAFDSFILGGWSRGVGEEDRTREVPSSDTLCHPPLRLGAS